MARRKSPPSSTCCAPRRRWAPAFAPCRSGSPRCLPSATASWSIPVRRQIIWRSRLLDLPKGAEVITPALTFATTVAPIVRAGLVPVFVDAAEATYNIDVDADRTRHHRPKTRAVMIPSLIGNLPDWDRIRAIADKHQADRHRGQRRHARRHAARDQHRHALGHQHHQLLRLACHHRRRKWRHDLRQRRRARPPRVAAALVGPDLVAVRRIRNDREPLQCRTRRYRLRREIPLRGARLQRRALGDRRRVRPGAARQARAQYRARERNFAAQYAFFKNYEDWFVLPRQLPDLARAGSPSR